MTEPSFFPLPQGLSLADIVVLTGATIRGTPTREPRITNVAPLDRAGQADITFLDNAKYLDRLATTTAGACFAAERHATRAPVDLLVLCTSQPFHAFVTVARALFPGALRPSSLFDATGVTSGAFVHPSARLESGVRVDPGVVIGPRAEIGTGTVVAANAAIGPEVRIGRDCAIGAGVSLTHALIGDRVIIHPGCRIGQD